MENDLPPNVKAHFAETHIENAARQVTALEENLFRETEENRRTIERFYNNLALFSGGTIALSVTYLGYLKTLVKPANDNRLLIASWACLFLCLLCSLFFSFFNAYSGHYYRNREYWEARKKKFETEAKEVVHLNVENLRTEEQLKAFIGPRLEAATVSAQNAKSNERRQKVYLQLWIWFGRIARFAFVAGLGLLLLFAVSNI